MISENVFAKLDRQNILLEKRPTICLKGVTGHDLAILKTVTLKFAFGNKILQHQFHVIKDLKFDLLLGIDLMTNAGMTLDFEARTLAAGKTVVALCNGKERPELSLVACKERQVIKPYAINFVKLATRSKIAGNCLVTPLDNVRPFEGHPGVTTNCVVTKGTKNIYLPVLNQSSQTYKLNKGQVIATAEMLPPDCVIERPCPNTPDEPINPSKAENNEKQHEIDGPRFETLLKTFSNIFAKSDTDLGQTHLTEIKLETGDAAPIKQRPYRLPYSQWPMLQKHLKDLQQANIIKPSQSPWASPILFVPRKDGGQPRMCVDYRKLNKVLVQNSYPLPNIQDILASMKGATVFSVLDLKSGYYQLPMHERDRPKTAFVCPFGLFEFNKLPFGISTAPSEFQEVMMRVLSESLNVYALVYLDDIIIFSPDVDTHFEHLSQVFAKLENAGLKLKQSKCKFFQKEVHYLGHIVSGDGIRPDPEKISAINNLHPPTIVREVRSLVGMASYYRNFIENFSSVVSPIIRLTKKHVRFNWDDEKQEAFELLKHKLTTAPILAHPKLNEPYKLYTDSSGYAVGAVLTQEFDGIERPIQYISKQLSEGQQKWPTIEREAYAIVYAVGKLRHFLYGSKFTIYSDHKPLKTLFTSEMKNCRIQRWAIMLEEYGADIEYKSGKTNIQADMLSRIKDHPKINVIDSSELEKPQLERTLPPIRDTSCEVENDLPTDLATQIKHLQHTDDELIAIKSELLSDSETKTKDEFIILDDLVYHIAQPVQSDQTCRLQLCIPAATQIRHEILEQVHSSDFGGGHTGHDKTYDKLRRRFYWKNMFRDVVNFIAKCGLCQARRMRQARIPMQDMPLATYPFQVVGIDTSGPYTESSCGAKYVITIIDHFSGWPESYAVADKSAETVAKLLAEKFIPTHGCPRIMLSDNGTEFVNAVIHTLLKRMKIVHIKSSIYHPQTNGRVERFHRFMHDSIAKYAYQDHENWPKAIPPLLMAYRTAVNDTTKHSPFFIVYGRDPVLPMDTLLNPKVKYMGEEYVPTAIERLHKAYTDVRRNTYDSRESNRRRLAEKSAISDYEIGDSVFYLDKASKQDECAKFALKWKPFYRVVERLTPVTYKIQEQNTNKEKIVHAELLRPALPEHIWDVQRDKLEHATYDVVEDRPRVQPLRQTRLVEPPTIPDVADQSDSEFEDALENLENDSSAQNDEQNESSNEAADQNVEDMETENHMPTHSYNLRKSVKRKHDHAFFEY